MLSLHIFASHQDFSIMRKFLAFVAFMILIVNNIMAQKKIVQTAGREQLGSFAPEFAHLNDDVLFGEVWSRNDLLSLRDRSLITVTALVSQGITDSSLKHHLQNAKLNGLYRTEIAEAITHVAFYAVGQRRGLLFASPRRCGQMIPIPSPMRRLSSSKR